jgi:hypothetical protein
VTVSLSAALLVAQAGGAAAAADFDLAQVRPAPAECGTAVGGEIVVCARRRDERLRGEPPVGEPGLPRAQVKLPGNVSAGLEAEQRSVGGHSGQAVAVKVRIPF